ncbi:MAG: non-homologous end-joining DNA ligase [Actinomycetota bacterium]
MHVQAMLATAAAALPHGPGWSYEFKWDGVRAIIEIIRGELRIQSRRGNDVSVAYPELAVLAGDVDDAVVDGEIVAFADGRPSFGLLQTRMHVRVKADAARLAAEAPVTFIAFDVLRLYGVGLIDRPLTERRATLERLAAERQGWTVSPNFDDGTATAEAARAHGLEGVIAKRLASPYRPGVRSADWIKVKFTQRAEFVVVGWEADAARPDVLSSLLLGYVVDDRFRFAGKVGSGLSQRIAGSLLRSLTVRRDSPLADAPAPSPGRILTWTQPRVVVEVSYSEWARDGRLRHAVFVGIRTDKEASEVTLDG